jgi:hypothetical protein
MATGGNGWEDFFDVGFFLAGVLGLGVAVVLLSAASGGGGSGTTRAVATAVAGSLFGFRRHPGSEIGSGTGYMV